jgi:hypothetical protein
MKVKDLIKELQKFDPELVVVGDDSEYGFETGIEVRVETREYCKFWHFDPDKKEWVPIVPPFLVVR